MEHSGLLSISKKGVRNVLGAPNLISPNLPSGIILQTFLFVKPHMHGLGIIYQTFIVVKPILCIKKSYKNAEKCRKIQQKGLKGLENIQKTRKKGLLF